MRTHHPLCNTEQVWYPVHDNVDGLGEGVRFRISGGFQVSGPAFRVPYFRFWVWYPVHDNVDGLGEGFGVRGSGGRFVLQFFSGFDFVLRVGTPFMTTSTALVSALRSCESSGILLVT